MNRRELLVTAPAAMIVSAAPVQASANPELSLAEKVLHHVAEIERLLQESAPENVTFTGAQWLCGQNNFWASGHWVNPENENDYTLAHFRPAHKPDWWIQAAPRIGGAA